MTVRYDESSGLMWIDAQTLIQAQALFEEFVRLHGAPMPLRGIIRRINPGLIEMIVSDGELDKFFEVEPKRESLLEMLTRTIDEVELAQIELAIYCEQTGGVCFSWENQQSLSLWKTHQLRGEDRAGTALRLFTDLHPRGGSPDNLVGLWNTTIDGVETHFFIAYVDREYEIEKGLWLSPDSLGGWKLDRSMVAAFSNSPRLSKLIRRSPA